ncbi:Piso0_002275 [Millerozyma farinosa CBS 7064]|uniref:DASH complex subunit DAD1 n=1 Tax=Pichia sorbitophila (strain ATCC MYA-4447 / BCRC 22081 / CBS 7064 / NBRC 10061 / NRRL Y-12695) TaxID=559304 RepID=G8YC64_PICSO|nr:Piso0_002275 [Millerozyma farinosa CBS 7064]
MSDTPSYFEKQRDLLIQEIGLSLESVIYNLDILNRSLNGAVSVGKEFDDVGRLWSHFYDGLNQLKERSSEKDTEVENQEDIENDTGNQAEALEHNDDNGSDISQ